jgi:hypothetical protein
MKRENQSTVGRIGILIFMFLFDHPSYSQEYPRHEIDPAQLADEIFPAQELDVDYSELYEGLLQYLSRPLDLNHASEEELRSLFILREEQLNALLAYRASFGPFLSVYEMQAVPTLDLATLYRLAQFVVVTDQATVLNRSLFARILNENNNYLITRYGRTLEKQKGYQAATDASERYTGSPGNLYVRYRVARAGDFSFGFTAEKDGGEAIRWNPPRHYYGLDYYSFHAQLLNKGRIKNFIAGDYLAQFGQGLALGGGFGMGLGAETITTVRRSNLGFIPYASIRESGFFRGMAVSMALRKNVTLHVFGSHVRRDGTSVADTTDQGDALISSLEVTGYHRTPSELATRQQVVENNLGGVVSYRLATSEAGVIVHHTQFNLPVSRTPTPYNQFSFSGTQNTNVSAFLNSTWSNVTFFSEAAQTLGHGRALVGGLLASLTRHLDAALLYRHYARDFYSFYSNAIAENSIPQNESGVYWGWKYVFTKKYSLAGYVDLFSFPWLRYRGYAPSSGSGSLVRFNYQPSKSVLFFLQVRQESKIRNVDGESNLYLTGIGIKRNYWINFDYAPGSAFSFKTRVQLSRYSLAGKTTRGMTLAQDFSADVGRFSFSARYSLFSTDDYDNRQYQYERDTWLTFTFPAYYGTGVHTYVLARIRAGARADFWIRWSHTRYTNRSTIGSEGETIDGNTRNDITLQSVFRF